MENIKEKTENLKLPDFDNILSCVHCGLCLDYCPTYRELGLEQDSPRGRLYLMRGLWNGELELDEKVAEPISRCLDCRACETACPSGVPYGELLEKTKALIVEHQPQSIKEKLIRLVMLKNVFKKTSLLVLLSKIFKVYIFLGIPKLITSGLLSKILPKKFVQNHQMIPSFSGKSFKRKHRGLHASADSKNIKVELFSGCILDVANAEIHEATLKVLLAAGCDVHVSGDQKCCGALHIHNGDRVTAKELATANFAAFSNSSSEAIITNAAGCGAQLTEYHHLFDKSDNIYNEILKFENSVIDIMEFLGINRYRLGQIKFKSPVSTTVLYDAPCHLIHAQGVDKSPKAVINCIPGVTLVSIPEADWCCGSAGVYNLLQPELSNQILDRKINSIEMAMKKNPEAKILLTGNPGCLFQIKYGVEKRGLDLKVMHPIVFMQQQLELS